MRTGLTISSAAHLGLLIWGLATFGARPLDATPVESMPVDIVSSTDFSKITAGIASAKKVETQKPLVEKLGENKPAEELSKKLTEKKEVQASAPEAPPPAEVKAEKTKPTEQKPDPIAEAIKKEEAKKPEPQKKPEAQIPTPPKKPAPPAPKFDAAKVAALLDKRDPQRHAATGDTVNSVPSLGAPRANAAMLSQSEIDALRARLMQLWNPPAGIKNPEEFVIRIRVQFRPDGTVAGPPMVLSSGRGAMFESARDSAVRALFIGQPFTMLRRETYDQWKDIEITFDPRDMFRG